MFTDFAEFRVPSGTDCAVDAVEDVFADFAYLGLSEVDESAGRFVCEVWLVILKCYGCVFVGCSVHSVVDFQFCRHGFVFFMDCLRRLGLCFLVRFCDVFSSRSLYVDGSSL